MIKNKKRRYSKPKIFITLVVMVGIFLGIKLIISSIFPGKTEDQVAILELTKNEKNALRRFDNSYHLEVGQKKGLKEPILSKNEHNKNADEFAEKHALFKIEDNRFYEIPHLTNSLPYLKPHATFFLEDLGKRFCKRLKEKDIRPYRFSVSSVLRTLEDQKNLRKKNVNATENNSSHYYGLTFDIAQTRFFERGNPEPVYSYRLRNELLRELIEMQEEGKCYVLLESQTKCIHVTVR